VQVCKRVNSSHVKLLYDIYHMQIMEGDVIRTIGENHVYIGQEFVPTRDPAASLRVAFSLCGGG